MTANMEKVKRKLLRMPTAVIFDMDGVLVDSERYVFQAWRRAARSRGYEMTEEIFVRCVGRSMADTTAAFLKAFGDDFPMEELRSIQKAHFTEMLGAKEVPPKRYARECLAYLNSREIPWAIATTTRRESAIKTLACAGLGDLVKVIVGGDEVAETKPAPDVYVKAAERLGFDPSECFAVEDSDVGARAAWNAGMEVVLIPDMTTPAPEIIERAIITPPSLFEFRNALHGIERGKE